MAHRQNNVGDTMRTGRGPMSQAIAMSGGWRRLLLASILGGLALSGAPAAACRPHASFVPRLGAGIVEALAAKTNIDATQHRQLTNALTELADLERAGKVDEARAREEDIMRGLGFRKQWLRCGPGSFAWVAQGGAR